MLEGSRGAGGAPRACPQAATQNTTTVAISKPVQNSKFENQTNQVADYEDATERLLQAHAIFSSLQTHPRDRSRVEGAKLRSHADFCARTHAGALKHLEAAQREAALLEAKRCADDDAVCCCGALQCDAALHLDCGGGQGSADAWTACEAILRTSTN